MKLTTFSAVVISSVLLAACGGGGSDGSPSAVAPVGTTPPVPDPVAVVPDPVATPVVDASTIVTSVPTPTYAAGSEEFAAFNLLNAERAHCGFGLLAQNTALDTAARGHADWLLINGYDGHYQVAGTPGFTGVAPDDRIATAGYGAIGSFTSNAEAEGSPNGAKTGTAVTRTRELLNSPYHMLGMIRSYRDVGVSVRDKSDVALTPNNRTVVNIDFGYKNVDGPQFAATGTVRTYPCDGSAGIVTAMRGENPNPVPGRNLLTSPLGSSVGVSVDAGKILVITSASMIKVSTGAAITLRAPIVAANDPNAVNGWSYFKANEGFVSADAPLDANTQYQVTINGSSSGTAFTRTFVFTTGA